MKTILILHYAAPPTVGGVEITIARHAQLLVQAGYPVHILAGSGETFHPQVTVDVLPELGSQHQAVLAIKEQLDKGVVPSAFDSLRDRIAELIQPHLAKADVLIAHNVFTLHKNLALTAALHHLLVEKAVVQIRTFAWHHDLAWRRAQYADEVHSGYPWDLLRTPWQGVTHVTVSMPRQQEVAELYGLPPEEVFVVPPGVDMADFYRWTETTQRLIEAFGLLDADLVFLLPARITRRKNIQLALKILHALCQKTELDARLVITGPPGPHNPSNLAYLNQLMDIRKDLGLEGKAHFVYTLGTVQTPLVPDDDTMADLYLLADALLFPSKEEGFGIPMLEAGLARLPIFCADIPPLRATGGTDAHYFAPDAEPELVAELITDGLAQSAHLLCD